MSGPTPNVTHREMDFFTNCRYDSEVTDLVWEIKDIGNLIRMPSEETPKLSLDFDAGSTIGMPSKWTFSLTIPPSTKSIFSPGFDASLRLVESPSAATELYADLRINIDGLMPKSNNPTGPINYKEAPAEKNLGRFKVMRSVFGSLTLHLTLTLFCPTKRLLIAEEIGNKSSIQFNEKSPNALARDLEKLFDSGENTDVTFQFKNGKILKAHKGILGARSPFFRTMFQKEVKRSSTRVIPLDDITFEAMKILLKFMYCGKVDEKLGDNDKELIQELLNASEKHSLPELNQFCSHTLPTVCKNENPSKKPRLV